MSFLKPNTSEDEIKKYLKDRGCAVFVWQGGSQYLMHRWESFIGEVERGYEGTIEEYTNDLSVRRLLFFIGYGDNLVVNDLDRRFRAMLINVHYRINGTNSNGYDDWWNFGWPRNASGIFLVTLREVL